MPERAAILISCLKDEAGQIRDRATHDYRSVSSYLLKITMRWVQFEERLYVYSAVEPKLCAPNGAFTTKENDRLAFCSRLIVPRGREAHRES